MDTQSSQYAVAWVVGGGESSVCTPWRQMDFETGLVTAPCHGPQLLWLILSHTCRLKGISEILFLEHCWFQAATHAFQTHSCSKHHATPDCAPPPQTAKENFTLIVPVCWRTSFWVSRFYRKRLQRKRTWGVTYTSKYPAASLPFSGAWFMCVFPLFESAPYHSVLCGSRVCSFVFWEPQRGDPLFSTRDELESSPSISASSVTHWTSLTPVIKLGKDGGLCTPQEVWSRSCSQTVLLTAHREKNKKE